MDTYPLYVNLLAEVTLISRLETLRFHQKSATFNHVYLNPVLYSFPDNDEKSVQADYNVV